jgi:hypothetical protein
LASRPPDWLGRSAAGVRILALLYALAFFLAGIVPMLLVPADRTLRGSNHVKPACSYS